MAQDYARHRDRSAPRGGRRAATRTQPPASTHWNWYVAGVLSGLFAVFIGYIGIANLGGQTPGETPVQQVVVAEEDLPVFNFYKELANPSGAERATALPQPQTRTPAVPPAQTAATPPPKPNDEAAKPDTATRPAATPATIASATPPAEQEPTEAPPTETEPATTVATATTAPKTAPPAATVAATPAAADARQYLLQAGSFQNRQDAESRRAKIILLNLNANVVPGVVAGRTWQRVQVGPFSGRQNAEAARALLSENNIESIPLIVR
jgi:cell division protein FtsN